METISLICNIRFTISSPTAFRIPAKYRLRTEITAIIDLMGLRHDSCYNLRQIPFGNRMAGTRYGRKTRFVSRRNVLRIGHTDGFHQLRWLMVLTPSTPKIEQHLGCCLNPFCSSKDIKQNLNPMPEWSE